MSLVGYILKWSMTFQQTEMLNTKDILDFSGQDLLRTPLVTTTLHSIYQITVYFSV